VVLEGIFKSGCGKAWGLIGFPQGIFASSRPKNVEFSTDEMESGTKIDIFRQKRRNRGLIC
jgi:hypothetical protein